MARRADPDLNGRVAKRFRNRCAVCDFSLAPALAIHHRIPVEFGGTNSARNLIDVCSNCHRLIHYFGADIRRLNAAHKALEVEYSPSAVGRLRRLAKAVQVARLRITRNKNIVPGSPALDVALEEVVERNGLSEKRAQLLARVVALVTSKIPRLARPLLSYRIPHRGKYFAINCTNYLLFRAPSYSDGGVRQHWDLFLILPGRTRKLSSQTIRDRDVVYAFDRFDCVIVGLSFENILAFNASDWREFRTACIKTARAVPSRGWSSNVVLPGKARSNRRIETDRDAAAHAER